jgi:hypothetical protein
MHSSPTQKREVKQSLWCLRESSLMMMRRQQHLPLPNAPLRSYLSSLFRFSSLLFYASLSHISFSEFASVFFAISMTLYRTAPPTTLLYSTPFYRFKFPFDLTFIRFVYMKRADSSVE